MNGKANVSKELNAKHKNVLEALLRLPENRECADCKSRAPRWASVNLGMFICMNCSGVHRSLGVHISKVRSATLDTWLPEQVAFIQSMGNKKSNEYWEAELPPNYDRVGIENFIRAKYVDKRWVSREREVKPSVKVSEERVSGYNQSPRSNGGQAYTNKVRQSHAEVRNARLYSPSPSVISAPTASQSVVSTPPDVPEQVNSSPKQVSEPSRDVLEKRQSAQDTPVYQPVPVATPPKLDYAIELFNMLSMDEPKNGVKTSSAPAADDDWAGFQSVTATMPVEEKILKTEPTQTKAPLASGIEDLFTDTWPTTTSVPQPPLKDSKDDILNLFNKSGMVSPFSMHQQQLASLAQQHQVLLMATAPNLTQQPGSSVNGISNQNWCATASPGSQHVPRPLQMGNLYPTNTLSYSSPSMYNMGSVAVNGAIRPQSFSPPQTRTPSKSRNEYDFSSLTQGMYPRR